METPERAYEAGTVRSAGRCRKPSDSYRRMARSRRLVAAGLGVSLAPACVKNVVIKGAIYREVHADCRTTIDLGIKTGSDKAVARASRAALESFHRHE